ncbi:flagellar filament capping protein FliD [Clostridium sp. Sa3CUN1]|uniref:Flagellar hook-associated protein 2 n=1 Tax=Clostridium gallinarum TaxID=2762246 RepID=A0ABR8Q865_9CLOT|nr:flagellar filament capping protein FliD [Clostridium gallinarum]MBD7916627.1 flagellar filament capping protein FliD [Clostridium gallinarum]
MTTRITGLATGLDVDTIVKQTMQAYRTKIDTQQQKKDVTEIKQQLYRDLIKEAQELYNNHFDVLKSGSLVRAATWQSVKFETNSPSLTVTGDASAKLGNYTIKEGSTIAKAASISKTEEELGSSITINGQSFNITGNTVKEKAVNLNNELSKAGINVSVKYTYFAGSTTTNKQGFLFESKLLGKDNNFVIGGTKSKNTLKTGEDAKGAEITGLTVSQLKYNSIDNKVSFKIDSNEITIDIADLNTVGDIENILNKSLSDKDYTAKIDTSGNITFITTKTGKDQTKPSIEVENKNGTYNKITIGFTDGNDTTSAEEIKITSADLGGKIVINGVCIDLSQKGSMNEVDYINNILESNKISVVAEKNTDGIVLKSTITGSNSKIEFSKIDGDETSTGGQDANIVISNGIGVYTHTGTANTFPLDGITFKFTGDIPEKGISVTSKQDSTEIIDKIKSYIEDYNKLIVKINTLTSEKRDRNYQPLTSDQKAEMVRLVVK